MVFGLPLLRLNKCHTKITHRAGIPWIPHVDIISSHSSFNTEIEMTLPFYFLEGFGRPLFKNLREKEFIYQKLSWGI